MNMRIEPEGISEALDKAHGAAPGAAVRSRNAGAAADRGKHGTHEDPQNFSQQGRIVGEAVAQGKGKRQHPLPDRDLGKDSIHEMGGGIRHAAPATAWTEPPGFTRKRDHPVEAAGIAVDAQKAAGHDSTIKEGAQLSLHKLGDVPVPQSLPLQETFQLCSKNARECSPPDSGDGIRPESHTQ